MMRKQSTAAFKARVVQDLLKEEKTLAQIASEYEVHPTQLKNWRAVALEGLPGLFEKQGNTAKCDRECPCHDILVWRNSQMPHARSDEDEVVWNLLHTAREEHKEGS